MNDSHSADATPADGISQADLPVQYSLTPKAEALAQETATSSTASLDQLNHWIPGLDLEPEPEAGL